MKNIVLSNRDGDQLGTDFLAKLAEIGKEHVIVHVSTFFNQIDEEHKAVIFYE